MHLKAYVVADKYFLGDLRELADSGVHNLLFDCWISENFLEAIEPMFKFDCPDESLKTDTVHGLVLCLPQYRSSEQLKTMLDRYPELARIALLSTAKKELVAVEGHRDKVGYCLGSSCRGAVCSTNTDCNQYCPDCGGAVEFWPGDESDENRNCDGGTKECVYDRKKPD